MSDVPQPTPRRPASARPRERHDHEAPPPERTELEAIEYQLAALPTHAGARLTHEPELGVVLVSHPGMGPGLNYAARVRWSAAAVAQRLAALHERMRRDGEWPALVVADGLTEPGDLPLWLESNGWIELERERVMWTRQAPVVPHLDPELRVEAVTRRSAGEFERVEGQVFGIDPARAGERAEHVADAVESGALRAFLVRLRGTPVASARLVVGDGVAGIFGVAVAADRRRRGYGSLVTAIATRAGLASGGRLVWLSVEEGNAPALALYHGLGYQPTFAWTRWLGSARRD
jgi:ribosomal protein S18 acetylase RimI-like enzyme